MSNKLEVVNLLLAGGVGEQLVRDQKSIARDRTDIVEQKRALENGHWIGETASAFFVTCADYLARLEALERKLGEFEKSPSIESIKIPYTPIGSEPATSKAITSKTPSKVDGKKSGARKS